MHPIDGHVAPDDRDQFLGNHAKGWLAHQLAGALVLGQGIVKYDLLLRQPSLLTAGTGGADVRGNLDEFFQHLRRRDGVGVVARDGSLKPFGEAFGLGFIRR